MRSGETLFVRRARALGRLEGVGESELAPEKKLASVLGLGEARWRLSLPGCFH